MAGRVSMHLPTSTRPMWMTSSDIMQLRPRTMLKQRLQRQVLQPRVGPEGGIQVRHDILRTASDEIMARREDIGQAIVA